MPLEAAETSGAAAIAGAGAGIGAAPGASGAAAGSGSALAPVADASFSGAPDMIPAMMLDGNLSTGWSNFYDKSGTANLRAVSASDASDWVSLSWPDSPRRIGSLVATFTTGGPLSLPASIAVTYWNGRRLVPVHNLKITLATGSNEPTTITFDAVTTSHIRLTMTSPSPGSAAGFLRIAELQAVTA
jgi:beta-galactosidase